MVEISIYITKKTISELKKEIIDTKNLTGAEYDELIKHTDHTK